MGTKEVEIIDDQIRLSSESMILFVHILHFKDRFIALVDEDALLIKTSQDIQERKIELGMDDG